MSENILDDDERRLVEIQLKLGDLEGKIDSKMYYLREQIEARLVAIERRHRVEDEHWRALAEVATALTKEHDRVLGKTS